jgi:gluconate 2-dehydrogenase gamma chain
MAERVSRRGLLQAGSALAPLASLNAIGTLTAQEMRALEAFVERLIPRDDTGPGAAEAGVAQYIRRGLAEAFPADLPGYQKGLAVIEALSKTHGAAFADLPADRQDQVVEAIQRDEPEFFSRIRNHALQGMFGDPYYGGNRGFAGWDLIRYPGARLAVGPEHQRMGVTIQPARVSAYGKRHGG